MEGLINLAGVVPRRERWEEIPQDDDSHGPRCRCGALMVRLLPPKHNSGTTRITWRCPLGKLYDWERGHQWVIQTTERHAATGCYSIYRVEG